MEDAHAAVLDLEGPNEKSNTFFAVYDGHGGMFQKTDYLILLNPDPGSTVARFAGQNVHRRLVNEDLYQAEDYEAALKKAFLGTDEDLLASEVFLFLKKSSDLTESASYRSCACKRSFRLYCCCCFNHTR